MRDIPMFSTEYGVASLVLREIPYRQEAYIRIQDTAYPEEFLQECVSFCRMAGAEKIYATGHEVLNKYPLHTAVWRMQRPMDNLPESDAMTMPVTEQTLPRWQELYNTAMANVPNASYMNRKDANEMLTRGDGYFVHRDGELLGIGMAADETIQTVIACKPGSGRDVLLALTHALWGEQILLEVASTNTRALRLYDRLGFIKTAELSLWYNVL